MRIALVDDDPTQMEMMRWVLTSAGHHCHCYVSSESFQQNIRQESFDMLVLDWMLPDNDGVSLMEWVRSSLQQRIPILFVTSKTDEDSIVQALSAGADDYMIKPLRRGELVARVNALLRRAYPEMTAPKRIDIGGIIFEPKISVVTVAERKIQLTQKEFDLALLLFKNIGKPLSRSHIQESVWGREDAVPSRTMDTHISRVRSKLCLRPEQGYRLAPVYSYGYRLERIEEYAYSGKAEAAELNRLVVDVEESLE